MITGNNLSGVFYYGIACFGDGSTDDIAEVAVCGNTIKLTTSLAQSCGIIFSSRGSYEAYNNKWFKKAILYDYIFNLESAQAMLAQVILRYAFQRWQFEFIADPSVADFVSKYDSVWIIHPLVPVIPEKTIRHTERTIRGTQWKVKAGVLSIVPTTSDQRKILVDFHCQKVQPILVTHHKEYTLQCRNHQYISLEILRFHLLLMS